MNGPVAYSGSASDSESGGSGSNPDGAVMDEIV